MVDTPPPSRLKVVEKGGRLVVIDTATGATPPSAAERMAQHNQALGIAPSMPAPKSTAPDLSAKARAESGLSARPAPMAPPAPSSKATPPPSRIAERLKAQSTMPPGTPKGASPWTRGAAKPTAPAKAVKVDRPAPRAGGARKTIETAKWWDSEGPRTLDLGPLAQQKLQSSFLALGGALFVLFIVAMVISPVLAFAMVFGLFRFGSAVLGPMGASIINKALAEPD